MEGTNLNLILLLLFKPNCTPKASPFKFTYLSKPVEGNPSDENVGEEFCNGEDGKDDPVHQPLDVVIFAARLDGLDGAICRIYEADSVAKKLSTIAEHQPEGKDSNDAFKKHFIVQVISV
jgi:hypothetical protein